MVEDFPCSGSFKICMGAHVLAVELDNTIRFSIVWPLIGCHGTCGIVPNDSPWCDRVLQYTSGLEMLECSIDTDFNYAITNAPELPLPLDL